MGSHPMRAVPVGLFTSPRIAVFVCSSTPGQSNFAHRSDVLVVEYRGRRVARYSSRCSRPNSLHVRILGPSPCDSRPRTSKSGYYVFDEHFVRFRLFLPNTKRDATLDCGTRSRWLRTDPNLYSTAARAKA